MKDVLRQIAARQAGCVASWQLRRAGWSWHAIAHRTRGLRRLHDGVYVTGDAPVTRLQRWWAATLTAPGSVLAFASAGAAYEMRPWEGAFEVIVREGEGGPRRYGDLLVCKTRTLHAMTLDGLPITTPERTLADLWPRLDQKAQGHMLRNALRLKRLTIPSLAAHLDNVSARQRPQTLTNRLQRYQSLQLHRCRSDAEALAVVVLADAGIEPPDINVRIAGEEADLSWPANRLIVEIDGGSFHQDKLEDARKTRIWRAAGWHGTRSRRRRLRRPGAAHPSSTPGFMIPAGSTAAFAPRSAAANASGRCASYHSRWSRPTAW
jgi:very-short-patch-repair endonuclease